MGAFGLVWGIVRADSAGWKSFEVVGALALGALLVVGFVRWELRATAPMLPMRLFRSRAFSAGNAAVFFHWGSALGAVYFMSQFLQTGLGYGPLDAGLRLMPWGATTVIVPQIVGRLVSRFGERPFIVIGLSINALALTWIALVAAPRLDYWQIAAPLILSGTGIAMSVPAAQSAVLTSVAPQDVGKASGAFSTMRQLGGSFGVAVLVAVFASAGSYSSAHAFSDGFVAAMWACAGLGLLGAFAGAALPRREKDRSRDSSRRLGHPSRRDDERLTAVHRPSAARCVSVGRRLHQAGAGGQVHPGRGRQHDRRVPAARTASTVSRATTPVPLATAIPTSHPSTRYRCGYWTQDYSFPSRPRAQLARSASASCLRFFSWRRAIGQSPTASGTAYQWARSRTIFSSSRVEDSCGLSTYDITAPMTLAVRCVPGTTDSTRPTSNRPATRENGSPGCGSGRARSWRGERCPRLSSQS